MTVGVLRPIGPSFSSRWVLTLPTIMFATSATASRTSSFTAAYSDINSCEAILQANSGLHDTLPEPIQSPASPSSATTPDCVQPAVCAVSISPPEISIPSIVEKTSSVARRTAAAISCSVTVALSIVVSICGFVLFLPAASKQSGQLVFNLVRRERLPDVTRRAQFHRLEHLGLAAFRAHHDDRRGVRR